MTLREMITSCLAIICATFVAWAPVACTNNTNEKILEAIKAGADPLEASCALSIGSNTGCYALEEKKDGSE